MSIELKLAKYLVESSGARAKMQAKLFSIFTETTGYRPQNEARMGKELGHETIVD